MLYNRFFFHFKVPGQRFYFILLIIMEKNCRRFVLSLWKNKQKRKKRFTLMHSNPE